MGLKFKVDPEVLIPRMDTEVVALAAELLIKEKKRDTLLDLCCGSGILGISLAKRCGVKVTATDINPAAKALTEINANTHGVKMTVLLGDLYGPIKNKKYHIIVSNPPYIPQAVIPTLMAEVKDYEPMNALDGGCDGLDFYRRIIAEAPEHLKKEGALVLEIGHDQGEAVCRLMEETGCFTEINIATDLAGKDRVVSGKLMGKKKK